MKIKVISEEIIKPSRQTPNHLRSLKGSLFDQLNTPNLVPLIFFYPKKPTSKIETQQVLDRLKGSLPNTLSVFYPLGGRVQDANYIDCNDEGVPYAHAEVAMPLDEVVHKAELSQLDKLVHYSYGDQQGYTRLLLSIQITTFSCGGLTIGVKMNQAIGDAFSKLMFVKTWASMANNRGHIHHKISDYNKSPYFEISKVFPPPSPREINFFLDKNVNVTDKNRPIGKWFMFNEEKLKTLRSKMLSVTSSSLSRVSLPMVLSSLIWSRFKVACHNSVNINIPHEVFYSVNIRPKVNPLLDNDRSYYFGNMYVSSLTKLLSTEHEESCIEFVVKVKESIEKMLKDNAFIKAMQQGKVDLKRYIGDYYEEENKEEIFELDFSDLRSLPVYEADFGWGKPVWVTTATLICKNHVMLIPVGSSTDHIVAFIFLSPEDLIKLQNDIVFNQFLSKTTLFRNKL